MDASVGVVMVDRDASMVDASDAGAAASASALDAGNSQSAPEAPQPPASAEPDPIGMISDLNLRVHPNPLRAHTWAVMRFRAARSSAPLHAYEVRVATDPIVDEISFIRDGRQAKNATDDTEGATLLSLPTDVPAGEFIEASIGNLIASTRYYVGVRATDELNRHGPISVADVMTTPRHFATVTPCFVASAAYGSPLAAQVGALRRVRDRYLMPHAWGRAWVNAYYDLGAPASRWLRRHEAARAAVRTLLSPIVALARRLP
jgi:hypothetical protein